MLKPRREIVRHFRCHKNGKPLLQLRDYWQKLSMQTFGPTFRSRRAKATPGSVAEALEMMSTRGYFFSTTKLKTCSVRLANITATGTPARRMVKSTHAAPLESTSLLSPADDEADKELGSNRDLFTVACHLHRFADK